MPRLIYIYFLACFTFPTYSKVIFSDVLNTALLEIRSKREAPCREDIDLAGRSGTIQLRTEDLNGTQIYRANEDCTWRVQTLPDHNMIITSEYFRIENSDDCLWDYVEIREQNGLSSRYCGRNPISYISDGNEIVIQFKSDVSYEDRGFKFHIDTNTDNNADSRCNSSIVGGQNSKIFNNEAVGAGCFYRIQAPADKVVLMDLKTLQFYAAPCEEESVLIFEGLTNQGHPLYKFCSNALNAKLPVYVNTVFVEYRNPLGHEGERFVIEYSFVEDTFTPPPTPSTTPSPVGGNNDCSGFYKDINMPTREMIYTAPAYQDNKECVLVVRNTLRPREVVQIHFVYFHIEDSDNCTFDSLRILSGERNDSLPLGGPYCGKSLNGRTLITNGNSLRLEFTTDYSYALRGFQAHITFISNRDCQCPDNRKCIRQGFEKMCFRATSCPINTCKNGGTCLNNGTQGTCYCAPGYRGIDCSESDGSSAYHLHFKTAPQDRALTRGYKNLFEQCAVETLPNEPSLPQYQWTFNGHVIGEYNKDSGFGTRTGGVLQIDSFRDELVGQYSCIAETSFGKAEHTFEYRLVSDCGIKFEKGPSSEQRKIGESVLLDCTVDPVATKVRWKKDDKYIEFKNQTKFQQITHFGHLKIQNLTLDDTGVYKCEVEDQDGCYSDIEGNLNVIDVRNINENCGSSVHDQAFYGQILGGSYARPNENPWHVIMIRSLVNKTETFCGGTVISQRFVLTAAHCITEFKKNATWSKDTVRMIFGTTDCSGEDPVGTFRSPKHYYIHPNFNDISFDNDIALIELDAAVEYTDSIRPICLKPASHNKKVFLEQRRPYLLLSGKVAGCGKSISTSVKKLQQVDLPYVPREKCEIKLKQALNTHELTENMICAGYEGAKTANTCPGDSGGGLMMEDDKKWIQTGIVSHGVRRCDQGIYGVYTNVGNYYDWIDSIAHFTKENVPAFLAGK